MRPYRDFIVDGTRWERFRTRPDDIVVTAPSKCGTTWMQVMVAMLVLDRVDLGEPIAAISPWLDALFRTEEETFATLEAQTHRRFVKTHAPLDGLPSEDSITYIAVIRHPLDAALSLFDHGTNMALERVLELRSHARGGSDAGSAEDLAASRAIDRREFLRAWIETDSEPTGSGPNSLRDFCTHVRTYWDGRDRPNVHLFHYRDLLEDLPRQMRRLADALGMEVSEARLAELVDAAGLDQMRSRAEEVAPEAHLGIWRSPADFFRSGGTRDWRALLDEDELSRFESRLELLAGDAVEWIRRGEAALER